MYTQQTSTRPPVSSFRTQRRREADHDEIERPDRVPDDHRTVRERLLDAAAEEFRSPDYPLFANVTLGRIARRAGVSERTAFRYMRASDIEEQLPSSLLGQRADGQGWTENQYRELEELLLDPDNSLAEAFEAMAAKVFDVTLDDPTLRSRHALWPYAQGNETIRSSLADYYELSDRRARSVLHAFVASNSDHLRFRSDTLTVEELIMVLTAVVDGLAMRATLDQAQGCDDVAFVRKTAAAAFKVILGAVVAPIDDDPSPTDDHLARLDRITGRSSD